MAELDLSKKSTVYQYPYLLYYIILVCYCKYAGRQGLIQFPRQIFKFKLRSYYTVQCKYTLYNIYIRDILYQLISI